MVHSPWQKMVDGHGRNWSMIDRALFYQINKTIDYWGHLKIEQGTFIK